MPKPVVVLPAQTAIQNAGWKALMQLYEDASRGWTLVGGQMVNLWCIERDTNVSRPTDDVDAVLDVRAIPGIHRAVTEALVRRGFLPQTLPDGVQHRWTRDRVQIDLLIPRHLGERAARRPGAGGGRTIETPGAQKALNRSQTIEISVDGKRGYVNRPSLLGALIAKAAAYTVVLDRNRERHLGDLVTLGTLLRPADLRGAELDRKEVEYLANGVGKARKLPQTWSYVERGEEALERLSMLVAVKNSKRTKATRG